MQDLNSNEAMKPCIMVDKELFERLKLQVELLKDDVKFYKKCASDFNKQIIKLKQKYEPETLEM